MNEREIFSNALQMATATERSDYLDRVCGSDPIMRERIERLLAEQSSLGSFMEHPPVKEHLNKLAEESPAIPLTAADHSSTATEPGILQLDFLVPSEKPDCLGVLGQYEILEVVAHGGMGIVLKGRDTKLDRIVAVKVLAPAIASIPTAHKRFLREARAAAAVSHDHIVTIYAVEERPVPHLAMEYIDGCTLQQKLHKEGELELKEVLRIGRQIAAGLVAAHEQGLIHRDIKPGNILLQNSVQRVQITDFGIARATADVEITHAGEVTGTPQYMSPEQAKSQPVDHRSDLFSLGSVLYAMCAGRSPFRAETPLAAIKRVCDDEPRLLRENNPEIPEWLAAIIGRLLSKNPDDRFQSAAEVADLLGKHLAHLQDPGSTQFPGVVQVAQPKKRKVAPRGWLTAAAVLLIALVGFGFAEATGVTSLAATVIRIATGEGTLVIEVDDPTVQVSLDGEELSITGAGIRELTLRPGQYQFQATKDGEPVKQELVSISRNGRQVVKVGLESSTIDTVSKPDTLSPHEAINRYSEIIRRSPDVPSTYVYRSEAYRKNRDYAKAIADSTAALRIDPRLSDAYEARALTHILLEDYEAALADSSEAIRLAPDKSAVYKTRAEAYLWLGRYDEALGDANRSVEMNPNNPLAQLLRAQICLLADRTEEYRQVCVETLDRFSKSDHQMTVAHAPRICVLAPEAIDDPNRLIQMAERAVSHYPTGSYPRQWMLYTLGMAHLRAGQLDEAEQCFRESLAADPKWKAKALDWLGLALLQQARGDGDDARRWLSEAIESMELRPMPHPQDRIEAKLLLREAEQLLGESGRAKTGSENKRKE